MMLSIRLRDSALCEGSGGRVNLPVMFVMFGGRVVYASIPIMVVCVCVCCLSCRSIRVFWHTYRGNHSCRRFW